MNPAVPVITVDGPGGTGKGTLCAYLASWLRWHMLNSGALYRALALAVEKHGLPLDDIDRIKALAEHLEISFPRTGTMHDSVLLEGAEVNKLIRTETCGNAASRLAALPEVRSALLGRQRAFRQPPGLVADGRDMGTVVFPEAGLKIFLTASPEARALRRHKQLKEKGFDVNLPRLSVEITERDARDIQRAVSPLRPADDAIVIDTTHLAIADVERQVAVLVRQRYPDSTKNPGT
jgi:cytidylate kinase